MKSANWRLRTYFSAIVVSFFLAVGYSLITCSFDTASIWRVLLPIGMGASCLIAYTAYPRQNAGSLGLILFLWIPVVLLRLALLPSAPSDDIYRYAWEGQIVAHGGNPYLSTVADANLAIGRTKNWELINNKDKWTAYPPVAQFLFGAVALISMEAIAFKIVFTAFDLLTLFLLSRILIMRGLSDRLLIFYAFNPIILLSYAAEGHFDSAMVCALTFALYLYDRHDRVQSLCLVALSAGIKWITLPFVLFYPKVTLWKGGALAIAVFMFPFVYYLDGLSSLFLGLFDFGANRSFNGPVQSLQVFCGLPEAVARIINIACFSAVFLWQVSLRERTTFDDKLRWTLSSLLVLLPTVHFWYLAWLIPFVCLKPSMLWLSFLITIGVYNFVWINADIDGGWGLTAAQQTMFWGPFALAVLYEIWSRRSGVFPLSDRLLSEKSPSIAVLIPTYNAEATIDDCLASIDAQTAPVDEVIVIDGGSDDSIRQRIADVQPNVQFVDSKLGRGEQIALGIKSAQSDWVVVLHSDAKLPHDGIERLRRAIKFHPQLESGAFGQRFVDTPARLFLIEAANDLRALLTRTAFGDQTQFFRRETALWHDLMPKQPLMEDVESSWRARTKGDFLFLDAPVEVGNLKWLKSPFVERVTLVLSLMIRYRWKRLRGRAHAAGYTKLLFEEYYPTIRK